MFSAISTSLERIGAPGRRFLAFTAVNIIAVHCVSSSALLILFARQIEMPPGLVGVMISFVPLSTMMVVLTNPLVERLGPRKLMARTWVLRNLLFSLIFLTPWAIRWGGNQAGWFVLCFATLGYSLSRAMGMGGWFPWLHEIIPAQSRGLYFSIDQSILQSTNILLSIMMAMWLGSDPTVNRFLMVMAVGLATGLASEAMIKRIPGGNCATHAPRPVLDTFKDYRQVLRDKPFLRTVAMCGWGMCAMTWLGSASVLYLREILQYSSKHILFLSSASALGVALTIRRWGTFSDRHGSAKTMSLTLAGAVCTGLGWFLLVPMEPWTDVLAWPVVILTSIFGAAYWAATNRAMLCLVHQDNRISYTNAWVIGRAAAVGITPIIAGFLIQHFHLAGYMTCFCMGVILSVTAAVAVLRIRDDRTEPESFTALLSRRARPLQILWQIGGIMLGPNDYTGQMEEQCAVPATQEQPPRKVRASSTQQAA